MDDDQSTTAHEAHEAREAAADPPAPDASSLEDALGYSFRDRRLFERALTHRSWAFESVGAGEERQARRLHNEVLEFVGDSVLGLVVAHALYGRHPEATEGDLSRMKHVLVNTRTLAAASRRLGLGEHVRVGRGEEKAGGRQKDALLEDAFEAVVAAVFLDGGFDAAARFVTRALGEDLSAITPESVTAAAADHKTVLQERLQAERHVSPTYELVETEGPPHARTFHVEAILGGERVRGSGQSIKAAEMDAACRALEMLGPPAGKGDEAKETEVEREANTGAQTGQGGGQ